MTPLRSSSHELRDAVRERRGALVGATTAGRDPASSARPAPSSGDYSTNAPLLLAPRLRRAAARGRRAARRRARRSGSATRSSAPRSPGPGFLNLYLRDDWFVDALADVLDAGERFGAGGAARRRRDRRRVRLRQPDGAAAHRPRAPRRLRRRARADPRVPRLRRHRASTTSTTTAARSGCSASRCGRARSASTCREDGYHGDYVAELAAADRGARRARHSTSSAGEAVGAACSAQIKASLERFGVHFDVGSSRALAARGLAERRRAGARAARASAARPTAHDGALWLRTTRLRRRQGPRAGALDGEHTYFASDIAYLQNKRERGFERQLLSGGADHHGYIARMQGGLRGARRRPRRARDR